MRCDFVSLMSRFICKFVISFYTFLCMSFHVMGPRRYCILIRFPEDLIGLFSIDSSRNAGFEHISVVCHNFITDFTLFLSACLIYVVKT